MLVMVTSAPLRLSESLPLNRHTSFVSSQTDTTTIPVDGIDKGGIKFDALRRKGKLLQLAFVSLGASLGALLGNFVGGKVGAAKYWTNFVQSLPVD